MPRNAWTAARRTPCSSMVSRRDSATHSDEVITMSMVSVTITGAAEAAPTSVASSGTPMKPEFGNVATSAPNAASFHPTAPRRVVKTVKVTMIRAHASQVDATRTSSSCAIGVRAPKRYSMHGSAKYSTKLLSPPMASRGRTRAWVAR